MKLELQYFGHLMRRTDSLEKTLRTGEGKLQGSKQPGVKTPLQVPPPFYAKQRTLSPEEKNGH